MNRGLAAAILLTAAAALAGCDGGSLSAKKQMVARSGTANGSDAGGARVEFGSRPAADSLPGGKEEESPQKITANIDNNDPRASSAPGAPTDETPAALAA